MRQSGLCQSIIHLLEHHQHVYLRIFGKSCFVLRHIPVANIASQFVSLIFESFSYVYQRSGDLSIVTREELRKFKAAWLPFDPDGTGYISIEKFPRLLAVCTRFSTLRRLLTFTATEWRFLAVYL